MPVLAEGSELTGAAAAIQGLAETVTSQGTEAIEAVLPTMGGLLALVIVINLGYRFIRKFAKA